MKFEKVISFFFLFFSVSMLLYVHYRSAFVWYGEKIDYYKFYYLFSTFLIVVSVLTFFLNKNFRINLFLTLIAVIFSFYVIELYIVLKPNENIKKYKKIKLYKENTGKKYDERNRYQIYLDMINEGEKVVVRAPPNYANKLYDNKSIFYLSGISNSKTIYCNENGYFSIYQSDRFGFNNPDDEWESAEIEFLLLGDSFTHGACVNRPDDLSSVIRGLSNKNVINLGYGGNGPLTEYATLKEFFPNNVKKVIWVYFEGNDLSNLNNELKNPILLNYLNNVNFLQNLKNKQDKLDKILIKETQNEIKKTQRIASFRFKLIKFLKIFETRTQIKLLIKTFNRKYFKPDFENLQKILKSAKKFSEENNSEFYFVYLPEYSRYKDLDYKNNNKENIIKILNNLDIKIIDPDQKIFKNEENPLQYFPFGMSGHFTEKGYYKIAELIYNETKN